MANRTASLFRRSALTLAGMLALAAAPAMAAWAQQAADARSPYVRSVPENRLVSIDVKRTTLLAVLDVLMKDVDANYTLDSHLQDTGIGAVRLKGVPFLQALQTVIKASNSPAAYRIENGVIMVFPRPAEAAYAAAATTIAEPRVSLDMDHGTVGEALKVVFAGAHCDYGLDGPVASAPISIHLHNMPLHVALEAVLRASPVPLTYRVNNGAYTVFAGSPGVR